MTEALRLRVLTWNVQGVRGIGRRRLAGILHAIDSVDADIVTLQEISARFDLWKTLKEGLRQRGYKSAFSGLSGAKEKRYGNVIASKFPVKLDRSRWAPGVPWRQLLARAVVDVPGGQVDVITAHIPNGSGNGWKKIYTFEALGSYLGSAPDMPRVLTGDFNEPDRMSRNGTMVSFGQTLETKRRTLKGDLARENDAGIVESHPRTRWNDAVLAVLDGEDLRHTAFEERRRLECTHVTSGGRRRRFDHLLVSKHLEVDEAGYEHQWRKHRLSDHSAAWASLRLRRRG